MLAPRWPLPGTKNPNWYIPTSALYTKQNIELKIWTRIGVWLVNIISGLEAFVEHVPPTVKDHLQRHLCRH